MEGVDEVGPAVDFTQRRKKNYAKAQRKNNILCAFCFLNELGVKPLKFSLNEKLFLAIRNQSYIWYEEIRELP